MNFFTLTFHDSSLEEKYHKEISQQSIQKFVFFMIIGNLLIEFLQILILFWKATFLPYTLLPCEIILIFIILYLQKKSSPFLLNFLWFNLAGQAILLVEMICHYQESWSTHDISLAMAIPFQIFESITIYLKSRWLISSSFYFCSLFYFFLRKMLIDETDNSLISVMLIFLSCWIIHSLMAYDHEKKFREFYKNTMDSYDKVNYFKLILKNVIPSSIFIIDYCNSKIKFTNNSGNLLINSKCSLDEFKNYEHFIQNLQIIPEKETEDEDLVIKLKNYYDDLQKQPIKAEFINDNESEDKFQIINVWTSSLNSMDTFSTGIDINANEPKKNYYEIKITKIYWEDSVCLLLLLNDNTNVFRISELVNLDSYKNQLLATVSHDLRTPLNGLNGMLELAIFKANDQCLKSYLELAKKSASFLNYLVHDILDFSLMNFKKLRLNIEEIDLKEIIEDIMSLVEFQAIEKHIELFFEIKNEQDVPFFSDTTRIKQILLNLLTNAIKFTNTGFIKVTLQTETLFPQTLYKISVQDTGIGIKQENITKLYRLFGRLEDQEKINKTGIGLGLTISKQISKFLCPEKPEGLKAESVYGEGSTFSFYLSSFHEEPKEKWDPIEEKEGINQSPKSMNSALKSKNSANSEKNELLERKNTNEILLQNEKWVHGESHEKWELKAPLETNQDLEKHEKKCSNNVGEEYNVMERKIEFQLQKEPPSPIRYRFIEDCERLNSVSSQASIIEARKVLIVDDDLMNLLIAEEYMKLFNFQTIRATNGLEAYKLVKHDITRKKNQICLVLMDCNMPIMDGFQASTKIKNLCKKMKREQIPILAVTANATTAYKSLCKSAGMEYFLEKPMRKSDLKKMLEAILNEPIRHKSQTCLT